MGNQLQYAGERGIPFAVIIGTQELESSTFSVKNLVSGEQVVLDYELLKSYLL